MGFLLGDLVFVLVRVFVAVFVRVLVFVAVALRVRVCRRSERGRRHGGEVRGVAVLTANRGAWGGVVLGAVRAHACRVLSARLPR